MGWVDVLPNGTTCANVERKSPDRQTTTRFRVRRVRSVVQELERLNPMHDLLRERLWRHLEALPEDRLYQVLDYVEFLSSKYARESARQASPIKRFGERLEDSMRINGVALGAIRNTMEAFGTADRVVSDIAEIGRSLLKEVETGLGTPAGPPRPPVEPRDHTDVRSLPRPGGPSDHAPE
jgi:hypothetical protein